MLGGVRCHGRVGVAVWLLGFWIQRFEGPIVRHCCLPIILPLAHLETHHGPQSQVVSDATGRSILARNGAALYIAPMPTAFPQRPRVFLRRRADADGAKLESVRWVGAYLAPPTAAPTAAPSPAHCAGLLVLSADRGRFSDGSLLDERYRRDGFCEWRIDEPIGGGRVFLRFVRLDLEDGFDFVTVWRGAAVGVAMGTLSGQPTLGSRVPGRELPLGEFAAESGGMLVLPSTAHPPPDRCCSPQPRCLLQPRPAACCIS